MTTSLPGRAALLLAFSAFAAACPGPPEGGPADLVVRGGAIHTVDAESPVVEALAVRDGRFVFVGSLRETGRWIGEATEVIELDGRAVIPGLIDGHVHLESGLSLVRGVDLTGIADRDEWTRRIAARAAELGPGAWIVGGRWDHTLSGGEFPSVEELDPVTPDNPVVLSDIDGHTAWANSLALELAGVDAETPDPPGGRILRYASGAPTGILLETAGGLVEEHVPPLSAGEEREIMRQTFQNAAKLGLTGVHTMAGPERIPAYLEFAAGGQLPLRVWYGAFGSADRAEELAAARDDARRDLAAVAAARGPTFEVGYAKLVADGVLSARTAALLAPYADAPDKSGFMVTEFDDLAASVTRFHEVGFPVAVHAIGDLAVRASLDAFEAAAERGPRPELADRIEHIEVLDPEDAPRFRELGVLASFNPHHCITGIDVYNTDRLGEARAAWSFAWGAARDAGATLVFGSDWATAPLDPLRQLYAATVRQKPSGGPAGGWHPEQRVSWQEALTAYTLGPAAASGWDDEIGSIQVGKWADFVVLSGAVPDPPDRSILDLRVDSTWLAGAPTHRTASDR